MTTVGTAGIQQQCVAELYRYVDKMEKTVIPSVLLSVCLVLAHYLQNGSP